MRTASLKPLAAAYAFTLIAFPAHALTAAHRLGSEAVPTFESVRLDVDAGKQDYSGSVSITLKVAAATDSFQLYAKDMSLTRVALKGRGQEIPTTHAVGEQGVLTVRTAKPLKPGTYTLAIEFSNDFNTRADSFYRLETGGNAYTFTQFEAAAAREAFPCWDEPEFKIPWQVTLSVPQGHLAVSNTPVFKDTVVGAQRRVTFQKTPPLPSYLIALATGPLETVPIPGLSVPGRIVTVKGASALTGEAVKAVPPILAALEKYFGRRYPYAKLDLLAVPEFWPGAMENAGAVTFRDNILVLDPKTVTPEQRRRLIGTTAHELAHMWFGDLVTMKWWDDLWLNESFASWMGDKIGQEVAPQFQFEVAEVEGTQNVMVIDGRLSTRAIRQPVDGFDNLEQAGDRLAYDKGQAVLGMLEHWLGAETFRQGVRDYLAAHAWGNAEGADLWTALSKASGRDVAGPATSFLNQPGVPFVEVELVGMHDVRLRQRRFLSYGVTPPGPALWQIPVTLKFSDGQTVQTQTVLLTDSMKTFPLNTASSVTWLHPNAEERGYYHWYVPPGMLTTLTELAGHDLSARERVGFVSNLAALLEAGRLHGDEELGLVGRFGADPQPEVVAAVVDALERARIPFVTNELSDAFAVYVRRTLGPALERIGPTIARGESEPVSLLRPRLMTWLGYFGHDERVLERGRTLADAYLKDPASIDGSLVGAALRLAALRGDSTRFNTYREHFEKATLPVDRERFLSALGAFRDSTLAAKALAYSLAGPLRPQEIMSIARAMGTLPGNEDRLFAWLTHNYAAITSRMPAAFTPFLVFFASGCSAERLEAARAFFTDPAHNTPGMDKNLARVGDQVRDCISLRQREGRAVARYLTELAAAR